MNCAVDLAADGTTDLDLALKNTYDLIIFDLMLRGIYRLDICRQLHARPNTLPFSC